MGKKRKQPKVPKVRSRVPRTGGPMGDTKYNRRKTKRTIDDDLRLLEADEIEDELERSCGDVGFEFEPMPMDFGDK